MGKKSNKRNNIKKGSKNKGSRRRRYRRQSQRGGSEFCENPCPEARGYCEGRYTKFFGIVDRGNGPEGPDWQNITGECPGYLKELYTKEQCDNHIGCKFIYSSGNCKDKGDMCGTVKSEGEGGSAMSKRKKLKLKEKAEAFLKSGGVGIVEVMKRPPEVHGPVTPCTNCMENTPEFFLKVISPFSLKGYLSVTQTYDKDDILDLCAECVIRLQKSI